MEDQLKFSTVHYAVREKLDISFTEYIVLDMVYHLSAKYGFCFKSTAAVARDMGLSFNAVKQLYNRLIGRGLLIRNQHKLTVSQTYVDVAYYDKPVKVSEIAQSSIAESNKDGKTTEIAQSDTKLHKVQSIAQTFDKNYSRYTSRPIKGKKKLGKKEKTLVADAYYLCDDLRDLIGDGYEKWFIKRFVKLGREKVLMLASQARTDGADKQKLFTHLLKKEVR